MQSILRNKKLQCCFLWSIISLLLCVSDAWTAAGAVSGLLQTRKNDDASQTKKDTPWKYRSFNVYTEVNKATKINDENGFSIGNFFQKKEEGKNPAIVLVHGFGCSTTYWRETSSRLVNAGYDVHALDLLGQGKSAKPGIDDGVKYSINLWADVVDSYINENVPRDQDVVLVGNSLGSLVCLAAATGDFVDERLGDEKFVDGLRVKGLCFFNCGVGLNSRGIANEPRWNPIQRFAINLLYDVLVTLIFGNRFLLQYALENVVTKDLLKETLQSLYKVNPQRVDDVLVDSFFNPAQDDGSVEALSQIYCNDPGKTPFDLHEEYGSTVLNDLPIHLVWGDDDAVTPIEGGVGQFYINMAKETNNNVSFKEVKSGHVPFDDNPSTNDSFIQWLDGISMNV